MSTAEFLAPSRCSPSSLCAYHEARVGISEIPPSDVYAQAQLAEIAQIVSQRKDNPDYSQLSLVDKLRTILTLVNNYWEQNHQLLDGPLRENYVQWATDAEKRGKFPTHGWMASPQQASQMIETLKTLREEGVILDRWLLLGTASGANTAQLVDTFYRADVEPRLFILDRCVPPIKDSLADGRIGLESDVLHLPLYNASIQAASAHFITNFIPSEKQRISECMNRMQTRLLKEQFFREIYRVLQKGGLFVGIVGTPISFLDTAEIIKTLTQGGFLTKKIILVSTTDLTDYDINTNHHEPGDLFLLAFK